MREIKNWCDHTTITVMRASETSIANYGPLVDISQHSGGMRFQHTMTPEQAREMAKALMSAATEAEATAAEVAA